MTALSYVISTVTTAASNFDLTTLDAVKLELQLEGSADNAWLSRQIRGVSAAVANYCNRVFAVETVSDRFQVAKDVPDVLVPASRTALQLSRFPLTGNPTVNENGTTLTINTDFLVDRAKGLLYRLDSQQKDVEWLTWPVTVTFSSGYTLPGTDNYTLPLDLEDLVIQLIKDRYAARQLNPRVKSEDVPGVGRTDYWIGAIEADPMIQSALTQYRTPVVA